MVLYFLSTLIYILVPFPAQAAARQTQFEKSAGGKAAMKTVRAIQEEKKNPQVSSGPDTSRDWLS